MGPRDHDAVGIPEEQLAECLGEAAIGEITLEQCGGLFVDRADHVAHDDQIGGVIEVRRYVPRHHLDSELLQVVGHGRVDCLIGARDVVPGVFQHARQRRHRGAGHAHDVNGADVRCGNDVRQGRFSSEVRSPYRYRNTAYRIRIPARAAPTRFPLIFDWPLVRRR